MKDLRRSGLAVRSEVAMPVSLDGETIDCGYRADVIVEESVLLELKVVEHLLDVHESQVLTYLKLSGLRVGLLINFNCTALRQGIRRFIR